MPNPKPPERRPVLGGLNAVLAARPQTNQLANALRIPVKEIHPNPRQPRKIFDDAELASLIASIRRRGLLQPIRVRRDDEGGGYQLIAGERRWRAFEALGEKTIPALVVEADDQAMLIDAVVENAQRQDLKIGELLAAI